VLYAVRTIIERRVALSRCLIVVEDLHWADAVSLEALRYVMDRLDRSRLMLIVTHRPGLESDQLDAVRVSQTALRLSPRHRQGDRSLSLRQPAHAVSASASSSAAAGRRAPAPRETNDRGVPVDIASSIAVPR